MRESKSKNGLSQKIDKFSSPINQNSFQKNYENEIVERVEGCDI